MTRQGAEAAARTSELAPCAGSCRCQGATAGSRMRATVASCREQLHDQVEEHPGRTLAAAIGAGYVVGGGLFTRFTGRVVGAGLRLAVRMAVVPLVAEAIVALTETALSRARHRGAPADR